MPRLSSEHAVAQVYRRHHEATQDLRDAALYDTESAWVDHATALGIAALTLRLAEAEFNDLALEQAEAIAADADEPDTERSPEV